MATCNRSQRFLQRCCTPLFAEQRKWNISGNRMRIGYPISLRFFSEEVIPDQREETILGFAKPQVIEWSHDISNKVSLMGTLTNGVDIKYLDSGKIVANCSIKVKCPPNIGTKEDSSFFIQFWDELAEIAASHLKREDHIFVAGSIWVDSYLGSDNVQKTTCKVVARDLKLVGVDYRKEQGEEQKLTFGEQWKDYFDNPHNYWDNRTNKRNPKGPDFKHKVSGSALWIDSRNTPFWVKEKLESLDVVSNKNDEEDDTTYVVLTGHVSTAAAESEKLWQAFFANPSDWWDNRTTKKNPRGPDFKHKVSGEALWIDSYTGPKWVKSQLEALDMKSKAAKDGGVAGNWPRVSNERDAKTSFEEADFGFF